jgi:hypothetical protein
LRNSTPILHEPDGAERPLHWLLDAVTVLRKGHRDLPVFFDELNHALEAHDAESMAAPPVPCGHSSRITMSRRKRSFIRWRKRVSRQLQYPENKHIFL